MVLMAAADNTLALRRLLYRRLCMRMGLATAKEGYDKRTRRMRNSYTRGAWAGRVVASAMRANMAAVRSGTTIRDPWLRGVISGYSECLSRARRPTPAQRSRGADAFGVGYKCGAEIADRFLACDAPPFTPPTRWTTGFFQAYRDGGGASQ